MGRLVPAGTGMEYYRQGEDRGRGRGGVSRWQEPALDAIPGYDEETRLQYAGGLPEDTGEESWRSSWGRIEAGSPSRTAGFLFICRQAN